MSPEVIRQCLDERPFQPFTVFLSDQNEVAVDDPAEAELIADGTVLQVNGRSSRLLIALGQIVSIKIASRRGNTFGFGS